MLEHSKINFDYIYLLLVHVNESEKLIPRTSDENCDIEEEGKNYIAYPSCVERQHIVPIRE